MSQDESTYKLDEQVGYLLRLANQRHAVIFQEHTVENLTPMQFSALIQISEQEECSQNKLGRLTAMDVATIKGVVDRLRHKGFAISRPDPDDKRRTLLSLSPSGKELIKEMHQIGIRISRETLKPLTSSERQSLLKILKKMS